MEAFPLNWPLGYKRTVNRIRSRFSQTPDKVQKALRSECEKLRLTNVIVSTNIPVRNDGGMYAVYMSRKVDDPGVAVYFKYNGKDTVICCDTFNTVWENIYAIAKVMEGIRAATRYGVSNFLDHVFSGFKAIPEVVDVTPEHWSSVLGVLKTATKEEIKRAYRHAAVYSHPDASNGSPERWERLRTAYAQAMRQLEQHGETNS